MKVNNPWLIIGGACSFAVAILHLVIIFIGADAYRYFGAGEGMATHDEQGSLVPAFITLVIVFVFVLFGLYAFSGSALIKRLWRLKPILIAITTIYLLRGVGFFYDRIGIIFNYDARHAIFSFAAFLIGLFHLVGLIHGWKALSSNGKDSAI